ncbi:MULTISPECIES: PA3496 family putative envelope integrity protein [unclassified Moraxella]|uniref:PA3496 family putative envelope integrity protein n=1 Tax=unclassified Moraxella TaxID=2685852 RepID=UPI003AF87A05
MADTDLEDGFEDESFDDDDDARLADDDASGRGRASSLEKRRLIDNLLEEKRLERSLKDGFDDFDKDLDDLDDDDDWDDDDFDD